MYCYNPRFEDVQNRTSVSGITNDIQVSRNQIYHIQNCFLGSCTVHGIQQEEF